MAGCDESALIAAAIAGRPLKEIAAAGGVSVSTAQRRMARPDVAAQIEKGRARRCEDMVEQLSAMRPAALLRLSQLIEHENPFAALRAIGMMLNLSATWSELAELKQTVAALAAAVTADAPRNGADAGDVHKDADAVVVGAAPGQGPPLPGWKDHG
jgi:hypothetical protein